MRRGFTLVEFLIVAVTIALIASATIIAFNDYTVAQEKKKKTEQEARKNIAKVSRLATPTTKNFCINGYVYTRVSLGDEHYLVLTLNSIGNKIPCDVKPAEKME